VRFSVPPEALATVMNHVPAESLRKADSFSDLLRDRLDSVRKPPGNA
jgi:hypothetical protein